MPPNISKGDIESAVWTFGVPAKTTLNTSRYSLWLLLCLYARLANHASNTVVSSLNTTTAVQSSKTSNLFELYKGIEPHPSFVYLYEGATQAFYVVSFDKSGGRATVDGLLGEIVPESWKWVEYVDDILIDKVSVPIFKVKWDGDRRVLGYPNPAENNPIILDYAVAQEKETATAVDILADPVFDEYHAKDGRIYTREQIIQRIAQAESGRSSPTVEQFRAFGSRSSAIYRPERQDLHNEIIEKIFQEWENKVSEHPSCIMLGGRGGSGKSKFNGAVYDENTYLVLDPDRIKEMLPEYPGWGNDVHLEGSDVIEEIIRIAIARKINVVLDGTMNGLYDLQRRMQYFSDVGYKMEAHYMFVPRRVAATRALMRFLDEPEGRYVAPEVILSMTNGERNFNIIKDQVEAWSFSDNNVPSGTPPRLVARKGQFVYQPPNPTWLDEPIPSQK